MPWDSALPLLGTKDTLVEDMAKTDSRTSKSIKKQFGSVGVLFHQLDPPVLFPKALLGLLGGGGAGAEYHGY